MEGDAGTFLVQLLKIMWINILLSGDNAVVIALACRGLPPSQRKWGIIMGAGVAIVMRIIFTAIVATLMGLPWLKLIGSILLFWIAVQLLVENNDEKDIKESANVWGAVRVIAIADLVMSLDNVIAIAAAAGGNWTLIILGLGISIPLIVFGAQLVIMMIERWPWMVWVGAALLGAGLTAVVLGGTSIFGGRGTIIGTVLGLILIQALKNGLALSGVKGDGTIVVIGLVLIGAILAGALFDKNRGG